MRYQKWGNAGYKLVCYSQQISKPYLVKDSNCDNETVWASDIENAVIADLMAMTAKEISADEAGATVSLPEALRKNKAALEVKLKRLYDLYSESENAVLLESINELLLDIKKVQEKIEEEAERGIWSQNAAVAKAQLKNIEKTWNYTDIPEKRNLICSVIEKITVTHSAVRIDYKY